MPELILYYMPTCPYCRKVLDYMRKNNISLPLKDISQNPGVTQELIGIGGKSQVPCLVIEGEPLYESDDIIRWLKDHGRDSPGT